MTQISGKIFPMYNAAKTERRFPETVLEAVLGLNSYLQNQFGALADIYMPIEGISESKPNQEFVYRQTPNTIKAKALTLDKIKGKTLAWNQGILDPLFTDITNKWMVPVSSYGTLSASNGVATLTVLQGAGSWQSGLKGKITPTIAGHKYLVKFDMKPQNAYSYITVYMGTDYQFVSVQANVWNHAAFIHEPSSGDDNITVYDAASGFAANEQIQFKNFTLTDLTLLYGSSIDGMTDAQILAKFESEYPGYHAYNPGALISNDAESLETVGFNQWNEEWENGYYNSEGVIQSASNQICSKNLIPVIAGCTYYYKNDNNQTYGNIAYFDANKNFISRGDTSATFTIPAGCSYIGFSCGASYGATYLHDICINISDPAKNGQYEPYRKSILPLNLNKIRVISPNIWDEEWEYGYYKSVDGTRDALQNQICTKNPIRVTPGSTMYFLVPNGGSNIISYYDANKNFVGYEALAFNAEKTIPNGVYYVHISFGTVYGTTYNHDICINKSDPAFNGKYFPHGVLTLTGGLKSAGSVYDEIVGNKYIKRVGSVNLGTLDYAYLEGGYFLFTLPDVKQGGAAIVCSKYATETARNVDKSIWYNGAYYGNSTICIKDSAYTDAASFKAAMDGVYLDYELANEEIYELAEPLPVSMPAGTTEERISPNADGLSAPFCADITYGMAIDNYAETAGVALNAISTQYAEATARLLNARTIWGQSFDGSANITGALSGVTNIDSLAYFDTTNGRIGIGISTPQYSLDISGTFRARGNSLIDGTLGVSGKLTGYTAEFESVKPSNTEYDSEYSINIPLWRLEDDGEAEFGDTYIRGALNLRDYYEGEFYDGSLQYDYQNDVVSCSKPFSAPTLTQSSDRRLKTDLSPVALTVEQIASAPAVEFNWVGNGQRSAGSIAQYWEEQLPYNVHHNGELLTMEYGNIALISAIVCARKIQELEEQVKKLEAKLNV